MAGRVEGKVALITGAASGLGAADARRLAAEGARVVLTDVQGDLGRATAAEIPGAIFLDHDVRDEVRWQAVIAETLAAHGRLDILVNNAGLVRFANPEELTLDDLRLHLGVMVEGTFLGCKHGLGAMKATGGSIINISSIAAIKGMSAVTAYAVAKAGIVALTRSVAVHAQEMRYGIRANAVLPGAHDTPMTQAAIAQLPAEYAGMQQIEAMGQGRPEDVANLVLFLASDEARQITGASFVIDNGETAR